MAYWCCVLKETSIRVGHTSKGVYIYIHVATKKFWSVSSPSPKSKIQDKSLTVNTLQNTICKGQLLPVPTSVITVCIYLPLGAVKVTFTKCQVRRAGQFTLHKTYTTYSIHNSKVAWLCSPSLHLTSCKRLCNASWVRPASAPQESRHSITDVSPWEAAQWIGNCPWRYSKNSIRQTSVFVWMCICFMQKPDLNFPVNLRTRACAALIRPRLMGIN